MNKVKRNIGDIWEDEFYPPLKWSVQFPNGVMGFKTKETAEAWSTQLKKTYRQPIRNRRHPAPEVTGEKERNVYERKKRH